MVTLTRGVGLGTGARHVGQHGIRLARSLPRPGSRGAVAITCSNAEHALSSEWPQGSEIGSSNTSQHTTQQLLGPGSFRLAIGNGFDELRRAVESGLVEHGYIT